MRDEVQHLLKGKCSRWLRRHLTCITFTPISVHFCTLENWEHSLYMWLRKVRNVLSSSAEHAPYEVPEVFVSDVLLQLSWQQRGLLYHKSSYQQNVDGLTDYYDELVEKKCKNCVRITHVKENFSPWPQAKKVKNVTVGSGNLWWEYSTI